MTIAALRRRTPERPACASQKSRVLTPSLRATAKANSKPWRANRFKSGVAPQSSQQAAARRGRADYDAIAPLDDLHLIQDACLKSETRGRKALPQLKRFRSSGSTGPSEPKEGERQIDTRDNSQHRRRANPCPSEKPRRSVGKRHCKEADDERASRRRRGPTVPVDC